MAWTAQHEYYGACLAVTTGSNYALPLPTRQGGARLISIDASVGSLDMTLPSTDYLRQGGAPQFVVLNVGSNSFDIIDADAVAVTTIAAGAGSELMLSVDGTWVPKTIAPSLGTAFSSSREHYEIELRQGRVDFNLLDYMQDVLGYDGVDPVAVRCTIGPATGQSSVVIGSSLANAASPAFDTDVFPTGSSITLVLEAGAVITGMGGSGGTGGTPSILPSVGAAGGTALSIQTDTNLVSAGTIQGGGGGGGGGARWTTPPTQGSGGGGGGAGENPSAGGAAGAGGGATAGLAGSVSLGGAGGTGGYSGGAGGAPGTAGTAGAGGGASGGAAGAAVRYLAAITWNKVSAGTITGAEVSV